MMRKIRLGLCGIGKAGKEFIEYILGNTKDVEICVVLCRETSDSAGKNLSDSTGIKLNKDLMIKKISDFKNDENLDVLVDFSAADTSMNLHEVCCKYGINMVICPNSFTEDQIACIKENSDKYKIGVVYAPVLTIGINVLIDYVKKLSMLLNDGSFEIIEMHEKNKIKPTKTARMIAESIDRKEVPIHSVRLNGFVGVHEVIMTDGLENIDIVHKSLNRGAFARAANVAVHYIYEKKGFYYMNDVVNQIIYQNSVVRENEWKK